MKSMDIFQNTRKLYKFTINQKYLSKMKEKKKKKKRATTNLFRTKHSPYLTITSLSFLNIVKEGESLQKKEETPAGSFTR